METIKDIVKEMRKRCIDEQHSPELWGYIDRIEAANKREIADALDTGAFVEATRKIKVDVSVLDTTTKGNLGVGNGAKIREALKRCVKMLDICLLYSHEGYPGQNDDIREAMYKAESALSDPLRNCDLPTVIADPHGEWLKDRDNWDEFGNPEKEIYDWLLAEAKGETK